MRASLIIVVMTAVSAVSFAPSPASAIPITWALEDVTFAGGGTATGSFVYNADTNTFSNINIATSVDAPFGTTYGVPTGGGNATFFDTVPQLLSNFTGSLRFLMTLDSAMTDAGGIIPIVLGNSIDSAEGICVDATCSGLSPFRSIVSGEVASTPLPAALPLFATGLGALGLFGWCRKRRARAQVA